MLLCVTEQMPSADEERDRIESPRKTTAVDIEMRLFCQMLRCNEINVLQQYIIIFSLDCLKLCFKYFVLYS